MRSLLAPAVLAALLAAAPAHTALNSAETRMVQTVDAEQERTVALLERLVNQNSGSNNLRGVTKVGEMMRAELEPLGFALTWKPMTAVGRAGHIIATHAGRPGTKRLLLIGHLDTVFEPDSPFQRFERTGDTATGPGSGDDKGGMVVMVAALRAMQAAGTLKTANIEIHLTGDEESAGKPVAVARADLIAAGKRADAALDFEGLVVEQDRDMGSIARRSSSNWEIRTTGNTGHSGGVFGPQRGDGAIYELARILAAFRTELPEQNLTFNVGLVAGGVTAALDADKVRATASGKTNIVPAVAIARGDLRTLSPDQEARVRARMVAIVARHLPQTGATIEFGEGYPPMAPTDGNRALLAGLNAVNADLGLPAMPELDPLQRGAGDIGFVAANVAGINGLGAAGKGAHAAGETVDLPSLSRQAKRAAILMTRLAAQRR